MSLFFAGLGLSITPAKLGEVIKSHFLKKDMQLSLYDQNGNTLIYFSNKMLQDKSNYLQNYELMM